MVEVAVDHISRLDRAFRGVKVFFGCLWEPVESLFGFEHVSLLRSSLKLGIILVHELEFLVLTRLVDVNNMLLSLLHNDLSDVFHISILRPFFDLNSDLWVLDKYLIVQELLGN
jgi:hypothetical protein